MLQMPSTRPEQIAELGAALRKGMGSWGLAESTLWQEFERRYRKVLLRFVRRWNLSPEDCEDLVQEVFIDVRKYLPEFVYDRRRGSFGGWLLRIARSKRANLLRRRQKSPPEKQTPSSSILREGGVDKMTPKPHEDAITNERLNLFLAAIAELRSEAGERNYALFVETQIRHRQIVEVAAELRMSADAARQALRRFKKRLATILEQRGFNER